jgi:alcohol dehydrogenase (cytochrome c)
MTRGFKRGIAILLLGGCALPALAQDAGTINVTADQLVKANDDAANWLMYNRTYDGHRYSPLDEINKDTVKNLKMAYSLALAPPTGAVGNYKFGGLEGTPLVVDGHMFLTDSAARVYKLDLTGGKKAVIEWVMDPETEVDPVIVEPFNNKGVALLGNNVYSLAMDGRLIATNADTGEVVWEQTVKDDPKQGFTMAPLAIGNNILIGTANGDAGGLHFIEARDAATGDSVWKFHTIPGPDEPGGDSWKGDTNAWKDGGGATWGTGTYDPATGLTYWGVGNPHPTDPTLRPGDNLYTNSLVALNANNGKLAFHFQYTPNESWDYDEIGSHVLVKSEVNGEERALVTHFGRNGFYYGLDANNGSFVNGGQYVDKLTWSKGLDPKTGKPVEYDSSLDVQTYNPGTRPGGTEEACPNIQGGTNYFPVSFDEQTKKLYAVAIEGCVIGFSISGTTTGSVVQLDPATGAITKKAATDFIPYGGTLSTAGGLVFTSQTDGTFEARDAESLDVLWSVNLGSQIAAPPITYSVNGKQYLAIEVGASPIFDLLGYGAKSGDPDQVANMQTSATVYFFAL